MNKISLSLSSWFCIPKHMKDMEILARASASIVHVKDHKIKNRSRYHILTSSHVVAPWKWPKYYQEEWNWLSEVNEKHVHYTAEIRHNDGMFLQSFDVLPISYHHQHRDVAIMHFDEEEEVIRSLNEFDIKTLCLPPIAHTVSVNIPKFLKPKDKVIISGHEVSGTILEDGTDLRRPYPRQATGVVHSRTNDQLFLKTDPTLVLGMCGGPVCLSVSDDDMLKKGSSSTDTSTSTISGVQPMSRKKKTPVNSLPVSNNVTQPFSESLTETMKPHTLIGVVEGIVPLEYPDPSMQGLAVIVEPDEFVPLIEAVETVMDKNQILYDNWMEVALAETSIEKPIPSPMSKSIPLCVEPHSVLIGGDAAVFCSNQPLDEELLNADGEMDIVKIIEKSEKLSEKDADREKNSTKSNFPL